MKSNARESLLHLGAEFDLFVVDRYDLLWKNFVSFVGDLQLLLNTLMSLCRGMIFLYCEGAKY